MVNRILNIVDWLHNAATENWLIRSCEIIAAIHPEWQWTFYCINGKEGCLDDRARGFGAKVVYSPYPLGNRWSFFLYLRRYLKAHPHDILHSQHDILSAIYLLASIGVPFRKRIVHIHNALQGLPTPDRWKHKLLVEPMRETCLQLADNIVGVSRHTLARFIRNRPVCPNRDSVLYCGIDTRVFKNDPDPVEFRRNLGFSSAAKVLLFAGRMVQDKNPLFVVDILELMLRENRMIAACFVGTGELEHDVAELARRKAVYDHVRLLGWRDDLASIMKSCDLLLFPKLEEPKEGLGLVLIEAQAAGLPTLGSWGAPDDAVVVPEIVHRISLKQGPAAWAHRAAQILAEPTLSRSAALKRVEASPFTIENSASSLMALYE